MGGTIVGLRRSVRKAKKLRVARINQFQPGPGSPSVFDKHRSCRFNSTANPIYLIDKKISKFRMIDGGERQPPSIDMRLVRVFPALSALKNGSQPLKTLA
jgi:hypothetical protein